MKITVIKTINGRTAVTAEQEIGDVEQLISFATKMGVHQNLEDFVLDFESSCDRTYIVGLEHVQ